MKVQFWLGMTFRAKDGTVSNAACAVSSNVADNGTHYHIPESEVFRWAEDLRQKHDVEAVVILSISPMFGSLPPP